MMTLLIILYRNSSRSCRRRKLSGSYTTARSLSLADITIVIIAKVGGNNNNTSFNNNHRSNNML